MDSAFSFSSSAASPSSPSAAASGPSLATCTRTDYGQLATVLDRIYTAKDVVSAANKWRAHQTHEIKSLGAQAEHYQPIVMSLQQAAAEVDKQFADAHSALSELEMPTVNANVASFVHQQELARFGKYLEGLERGVEVKKIMMTHMESLVEELSKKEEKKDEKGDGDCAVKAQLPSAFPAGSKEADIHLTPIAFIEFNTAINCNVLMRYHRDLDRQGQKGEGGSIKRLECSISIPGDWRFLTTPIQICNFQSGFFPCRIVRFFQLVPVANEKTISGVEGEPAKPALALKPMWQVAIPPNSTIQFVSRTQIWGSPYPITIRSDDWLNLSSDLTTNVKPAESTKDKAGEPAENEAEETIDYEDEKTMDDGDEEAADDKTEKPTSSPSRPFFTLTETADHGLRLDF